MKKQTIFRLITTSLLLLILIGAPTIASAQSKLVPCGDNCKPCHFVQLLANIGQLLTGIVGSLALLYFIYGSFTWLVSAGKSDWVSKGKTIMINSIIGLFIVMLSYTIVTFTLMAVSEKDMTSEITLFGVSWSDYIVCEKLEENIKPD
jgi:hypothetical protein